MKIRYLIILVIAIAFSSCKVQEVSVGQIEGIQVKELTSKSVELEILVPIENKNNFKFKIKKVNLDIELDGKVLGTVKEVRNVKIPANSNETHQFLLKVEMSKVLGGSINVLASMMNKKKTKGVRIKGYITAKAFWISKRIDIDENKPLNIFKGMN